MASSVTYLTIKSNLTNNDFPYPISVLYLNGYTKEDLWNKNLDFTVRSLEITSNGKLILPLQNHSLSNNAIAINSYGQLIYNVNGEDKTINPGYHFIHSQTVDLTPNDYLSNGYYSIYTSTDSIPTSNDSTNNDLLLWKKDISYSNLSQFSNITSYNKVKIENLYIDESNSDISIDASGKNLKILKLKNIDLKIRTLYLNEIDYIIIEDSNFEIFSNLIIHNAKTVIFKNTKITLHKIPIGAMTNILIDDTINIPIGDTNKYPVYRKDISTNYTYNLDIIAFNTIKILDSDIIYDKTINTFNASTQEIYSIIKLSCPNITINDTSFSYKIKYNSTVNYNIAHPPILIYNNKYFVLSNSTFNISSDMTRNFTNIAGNPYFPTFYQFVRPSHQTDIFNYRFKDTIIWFEIEPVYINVKNNFFNLKNYAIIFDSKRSYYDLLGLDSSSKYNDSNTFFIPNGAESTLNALIQKLGLYYNSALATQSFIFKNNKVNITGDITNWVQDQTISSGNLTSNIFELEISDNSDSSTIPTKTLFNIIPQSQIQFLSVKRGTSQYYNEGDQTNCSNWRFIRGVFVYNNKISNQSKYTYTYFDSVDISNFSVPTITSGGSLNYSVVSCLNSNQNTSNSKILGYFEKPLTLPFIYRTIPHTIGWGWKWNDANSDWSKFAYDDNLEDIL